MGFPIHLVNSEVSLCKEDSVQNAGGLMVSKTDIGLVFMELIPQQGG